MSALAWSLPLLPVTGGALLWPLGARVERPRRAAVLGAAATATLAVTAVLAAWAAAADATATHVVGPSIELVLELGPIPDVVAVLVPAVAAVVAAYAAVHEDPDGLPRLLGLLTVFAGTMLLLVLAADLVTLTVAFELVAALSWALIGHDWRDPDAPRAAAHAFNATRFGALGLVLAAGAAFGATGSFAFDRLPLLHGGALHVVVAGIVLAAVSKSAQVPFSPWLFSAMAGPTPVSALLHSSTMVAAGAYVLIRLQPVLDGAAWFAPTVIAFGLATALAGGVVAALQGHAKKLLAASTSAQYGLMLVAVGAGYPAVAAIHLVVHAVFKAQLFLSAGVAMHAQGSPSLARMRLGTHLPAAAALTAVGSLSLAAVPPLGGAWSKESVMAGATHHALWLGLLVGVAGGLSALYAARFQLLAFGPHRGGDPPVRDLSEGPHRVELAALALLAAAAVGLGALWVPGVHEAAGRLLSGDIPDGAAWELVVSVGLVAAAGYAAWAADRAGRLGGIPRTSAQRAAADWLALPALTRAAVVDPALALADRMARFDDRVVDGGVRAAAAAGRAISRAGSRLAEPSVDGIVRGVARATRSLADASAGFGERLVDGAVGGVAWIAGRGGEDSRRIQTGMVHHQYVVIAVGLIVVVLTAALGR